MSLTVLIVEKTGKIKELQLKTYNEEDLYKKAGFKTVDGFELQTEWGAEIGGKQYNVSVYGKAYGRAGQENKYEFPPPIDNTLLFGACVLVNKKNAVATSITKDEWKTVYEHLYGGFEDIGDEDSEESEDDVDDNVPRTKEGYVKDDFVVDDDDTNDSDYSTEETETEEEEVQLKSKSKKIVKKETIKKKPTTTKSTKETTNSVSKKKSKPTTVFENLIKESEENGLDFTNELCEESYV